MSLVQRHAAIVEAGLPLLTGSELHTIQESLVLAVLRRPGLSPSVARTGIGEQDIPPDLRAAFNLAMANSQDEIRHLVAIRDPRVWPLYHKRIIEWTDGQAVQAAKQIKFSMECAKSNDPGSHSTKAWADRVNAETRADHLRAAAERASNGKVSAVSTNGSSTRGLAGPENRTAHP